MMLKQYIHVYHSTELELYIIYDLVSFRKCLFCVLINVKYRSFLSVTFKYTCVCVL